MRGSVMAMGLAVALTGGATTSDAATQEPAAAAGEGRQDAERAKVIEGRLEQDPSLRDDAINVGVNGRTVTLDGEVDDADEKQRAEEVVRASDPTLRVENRLDVPVERRARTQVDRASNAAEGAVEEAGDAISDGAITASIKAKLLAADDVDARTIDIDTENQVVTLRGRIRTETQRARAIEIARGTDGVLVVVDELKLTAARPARR